MDKQLPSVISIGELWLFMIGIVASVALLIILMIPFVSRIYIPTRLWLRGVSFSDSLLLKLKSRFERDGCEVLRLEHEEGGLTCLELRSDSVTYTLELVKRLGEHSWAMRVRSDSLDLSADEPLSILSSAGPGWFVLRLEQHLKACVEGVELSWSRGDDEADARPRPLGPLARYAVTIAPWR